MPDKPIIVLDRDGVINEDRDDYVRTVEQWTPIPGSLEAIGDLTRAGFRIAVASNQSGLARGYFDPHALNAMHRKLHDLVRQHGGRIEMILFCPHGPWDHCGCRKPHPGLLREIETRTGMPLRGAPMVGDSLSDITMARLCGMDAALVMTGKGLRTLTAGGTDLTGVTLYDDLRAFAAQLIKRWGES